MAMNAILRTATSSATAPFLVSQTSGSVVQQSCRCWKGVRDFTPKAYSFRSFEAVRQPFAPQRSRVAMRVAAASSFFLPAGTLPMCYVHAEPCIIVCV